MSDPLSEYLFENPTANLSKPQLEENLNYLNNSLISQGFPSLGNLFSTSLEEIKSTIDCIYSVLHQLQKDLKLKSQVQDRIQKLESEKSMYQQKIEFLNEDKNSSNSEAGKAQNKLLQETSKFKKEREKIIAERENLRKEITKMLGRESKLWHEIKKKETGMEKMKEQLRKVLGDKDLLYQNNVDLVSPLHEQGAKLVSNKAEEEFANLITKGYDDNQNALLNENQELRSALETIQKELHILMDERREDVMQNRKRIPNIHLIEINPEVFNVPFQSVCEDLVETFIENIKRFKQFMQLTSNLL